jgi:hypothetical protein
MLKQISKERGIEIDTKQEQEEEAEQSVWQ